MVTISWGAQKANKAYATYIGREGCEPCLGVDIFPTTGKRLTITPAGVEDCQIDIPLDQVDAFVAAILEAKTKAK